MLSQKRFVLSLRPAGLLEALPCFAQAPLPISPAVLAGVRSAVRLQPASLDQWLQRDQARVAGVGRLRRIGR